MDANIHCPNCKQPISPEAQSFVYVLPGGLLLIATILAISVFYPKSLLTDDYPTLKWIVLGLQHRRFGTLG